jgi:hypothetical protein
MNIATVVIQIVALLLFIAVALDFLQIPPTPRYIRFIAGGLFLWLLSLMIVAELHAAH